MPIRRALLPIFLVGLSALPAPALARSGCERARAELASLERSERSGAGMAAAAQQHRGEAQRLAAYYRSIGCEGGQLSFFGAPPECGALAQRIRSMESTSISLAASSSPGATNARRGRLRAAVARECQPVEPREAAAKAPDKVEKTDKAEKGDKEKAVRATGGPRLVCVRACDGYFFPLENRPSSKQGASEMCQALCPNADTIVFNAPADGDISKAVSEKGKPYVKLANASRYQKTFDKSCSCKKEGQTWAQALERAESLLDQRKGDVIVTAKLSETLSRPKLALAKLRAGKGRTRPGAADEARKALPDGLRTTFSAQGPKSDPDATGTVKPGEEDGSADTPRSVSAPDVGTPSKPRLIKISGN